MTNLKNSLMKILDIICIILMIGITVIGTYQVVTRYFLNNPSAWSEELLTYAFTWMVFLGSAIVFGKREHMRLTFVQDKFGPEAKKKIEILVELLIILFAAVVLVYGGISIVKLTYVQTTPALQWSTGLLYSILSISGILIILFSVMNIIDISKGNIDVEEMEEIK